MPALLSICGAAFLVFLDTTIVNVSFPGISRDFASAGFSELVWVLDAYFVALAAAIVPAGLWADQLGRRKFFIGGTAVFLAASLICAVAPDWQILVGARVLQALGGAVMVSTSLALIMLQFSDDRRASAVGLWGAAAAVAAAAGPPLGGLLVDSGSWRWIFLVNIPIGLLVLTGARSLPESRDLTAKARPDLFGAVEVAVALGLIALSLTRVHDWGWGSPEFVAGIAAGLLLIAHVWIRSGRHQQPVFDHSMVRERSFAAGTAGTALFATAFFAVLLVNVLFLTSVWGYSELHAGLSIFPSPIVAAVFAAPAGMLADRFGHRWVIVAGTLLYATGAVLNSQMLTTEPNYMADFLPGMLLIGAGIGLAFPTLSAAAMERVTSDRFATATSLNSAMRQVGAVLGTALVVAILGETTTGLDGFHAAYLLGAAGALMAGSTALLLRR
jgi:EmrB/QacA subfamily drug resistance transporter